MDFSAFHRSVAGHPNALLEINRDVFWRKGYALDIGSGSGRNSKYLTELDFIRVTAIDIDPRVQEYYDRENQRIEFIVQDCLTLKYIPKTYDAIIAIDVFQFIPKDKIKKLSEQLIESLKPNGVLMFTGLGCEGECNITHNNELTRLKSFEWVEMFKELRVLWQKKLKVRSKHGKFDKHFFTFRKTDKSYNF